MPYVKYRVFGTTLFKYCQENNISYKIISEKIRTYGISPEEALTFTKQKGYKKFLYSKGITKENPKYSIYYRRLVDGWNPEKAVLIPIQTHGGNRRKRLDKY